MKEVTIIIPARNEEKVILKTLRSLINDVKVPHEIIIVDDHSDDRTSIVVKKYIKKHRNVYLIKNKLTPGFTRAIYSGFKAAKTKYVVPVMADSCDDPKTINKMYDIMTRGKWDVVCGSRYMSGGGKTGGPLLQGLFSRLIGVTLRFLIKVPTSDISNAFKMYRRKLIDKLEIRSEGVEFSMDITLQLYSLGAKITEVPTFWTGRTIGQSKFKLFKRAPKYIRLYANALKKFYL